MENKNIYKGLECHCNEFEKIPIHRRDFGTTGVIISNGLVITENLSIETLDKHLKNNGIEEKIRKIPKINIMMNFGILNFLYKKTEGKSNQRALTELGVETSIGLATTSKLAVKTGVSLLTRIATGAATGAAVGSTFPIVGTIIGAVAGTLIAGAINEQCEFDKNLPQKQKTFNDLGSTTENFLNIYLPANAGFGSAMSDTIYPKNRPFYVPNIPTITLGVNYGVIVYLFKKQRERVINE